jgi:phage internal scaffolding protein
MTFIRRIPKPDVSLDCSDSVSMTEQCHLPECKIQNIMAKYEKTNMLNHVAAHQGSYMDVISAPDFVEAQRMLAEANSMFESIPSKIREDFGNDPALFLEFIQDPKNKEKMEEYGFDVSHLPSEGSLVSTPTPTPTSSEEPTSKESESPQTDS